MFTHRTETEAHSRAHISSSALHPVSRSLVRLLKSFHYHLRRGRGYPSLEFHRTFFSSKESNSLGSKQSGHILCPWNCTEFIFCLQGHFFSTTNCCWIAQGQTTIRRFASSECLHSMGKTTETENVILHLTSTSCAMQTDYCTILQTTTESLPFSKTHKRKSGRKAFFPRYTEELESLTQNSCGEAGGITAIAPRAWDFSQDLYLGAPTSHLVLP